MQDLPIGKATHVKCETLKSAQNKRGAINYANKSLDIKIKTSIVSLSGKVHFYVWKTQGTENKD